MRIVMRYILGFLSLVLTTSAFAVALKIDLSATSPGVPMAGIAVLDFIDGDGVSGSSAVIRELSVLPSTLNGSVTQINPGEYLVTDDQVISSLFFDLANVYAGFKFTVDTFLVDPGALGFPDAFILSLIDVNGTPLFTTADPRGTDALVVLSPYSPEVYTPTGFSISLTSPSAIPEPTTLWLLIVGVIGFILTRYKMVATLLFALGATAPAQAALMDVTTQVSITRAPLVYSRVTQTFNGLVTVRNVGGTTLESPMFLEVSGIPNSVSVYNATSLSTAGQPMLSLPIAVSGLAPGQAIANFSVKFHNPNQLKFTPAFKVLSNSGHLPPDPGGAGKATIAGVDSNRNEIRDDVEIYIVANFGNSQKRVAVLNQAAIAMQKGLTAQTEQQSMQAANLTSRAMECLEYIAADDESWKSVHAISVNTPERFAAWRAHESRLSGKVFPGRAMRDWKTSCSFNPDALSN